ncbi:MAG: hypothetical protein ACI9A7_000044 [Cyclobacteriaceae bacterium]|jgi:hypothetical protein
MNKYLPILKYIFSLFLFILSIGAFGQVESSMQSEDSTSIAFRVNLDLIPLGRNIFVPAQKSGFEIQTSVLFNQYRLHFEYGSQRTKRGTNYDYNNKGQYFRIGPEINLLKNAKDGLEMTFGLRYAQSTFDNSLSYETNDFFGSIISIEENRQSTRWLEITTGLSAKIGKRMTMGYTVRYKIQRKPLTSDQLLPYDIPGFGRRDDSNEVGFNYYIGWLLPLK